MLERERYKEIYESRAEEIFKTGPIKQSIRANTIKIEAGELKNRLEEKGLVLNKIPWLDEGFLVKSPNYEQLFSLSKIKEHILGYFFLQNASSMLPPLVLDPKKDDRVLDLAASPGAKTTQMAAMMGNEGIIIANDITFDRLKALRGNLQRCGVINTVITKMWGETFYKTGLKFDKILLDAPCSATGTCKPKIFQQTSLNTLVSLSRLQKKLVFSASKMLEKKGEIVYSTCSLEPEENEEVVDYSVRELGLKVKGIKIKDLDYVPGILEFGDKKFDESMKNTIRVIPNQYQEGFFICKLVR